MLKFLKMKSVITVHTKLILTYQSPETSGTVRNKKQIQQSGKTNVREPRTFTSSEASGEQSHLLPQN